MQNRNLHPQRQSIRLQEYDYAQPGAYFVTVVSHKRMNIFGEIVNGEMQLNQLGEIVKKTWNEIPLHFPNTSCEIFVIMPNHIHGIINIIEDERVGARHHVSRNEDRPRPYKNHKTVYNHNPLGQLLVHSNRPPQNAFINRD